MSDVAYTITTNSALKLARIHLYGHWPASTAIAFGREVQTKFLAMRAQGVRPGEYLTYVDASKYEIQSQETAAIYESLISSPETTSRKIAFVAPAALARLQAARVASYVNHRFFLAEAEALSWLLQDAD